jgi:hypothetical protein
MRPKTSPSSTTDTCLLYDPVCCRGWTGLRTIQRLAPSDPTDDDVGPKTSTHH